MDESGKLIGIIGDEDTVTGFILAGIGHRNVEGQNFMIVKPDTDILEVEEVFKTLTNRTDIGILLINQSIANDIRALIRENKKAIPTILEIPSKDQPYDPEQDSVMQRVNMMLGFSG
mmetsp:Transcript_15801/g.15169  ORF Transcript_15801/g.15169 Transcript_15801/m.15169 type:complete len:117 (-) Transcript_15801:330-680(-)|eukprot:CAMPEP_0119033350 /NCGR_PEP_ID=MMETSP1177-20130426/401_1 /TAXON_ID=2985 /ORGANISM="Ochromonas sp, Strain CCMP1899" /LENGTH=116 /DNA_ID=CAMNT_0006990033 /DNA_START=92 /DNA_END=442 /DNA_ORIENTATION=+